MEIGTYADAADFSGVVVTGKGADVGDGTSGPYALALDPGGDDLVDVFVGGAPQAPVTDYRVVDMVASASGKGIEIYPNAPLGAEIRVTIKSPSATTSATDPELIIMPSGDSLEDVTSQLKSRSGGGVSWNTAGVTLSLGSRANLMTYLALHSGKHANGDKLSDGTVTYVYSSGATEISGMDDWLPDGMAFPEHYAANTTPGTTNMTAAVAASVAYNISINRTPHWNGGTYKLTGNVANLLIVPHTGKGTLVSGSDTFYIGDKWFENQNVIYVSPSGSSTNDGLTASTPLDLTHGFNAIERQARGNPVAKWKMQLVAGTYPEGASRRLENFPSTAFPVEFVGPEVSGGTPTAIFDGWTSRVFYKLGEATGLNIIFRDLLFTNFTAEPIYLQGGINVDLINCHFDGGVGNVVGLRGGYGTILGGRVENISLCTVAIALENFYGGVGTLNEDGPVFNNITNATNTADCVYASRKSSVYVSGCSFGVTSACDNFIHLGWLARVRSRKNVMGSFNNAIYLGDELGVLTLDSANYDDVSGCGATLGDQPIQMGSGAYIAQYADTDTNSGYRHLTYKGAALSAPTGTSRNEIDNALSPFRMPGLWLYSPTARGYVEYLVQGGDAEDVTFQVTGEASGAVVLATTTITTTAGRLFTVRLEFTGPLGGGTSGYGKCFTNGNAGQQFTNIVATDILSQSAITALTMVPKRFRLYVQRTVGVGDLRVREMNSVVEY